MTSDKAPRVLWFELAGLSNAGDPQLNLSQARALGPALSFLAQGAPPRWIVVCYGVFANGIPSLRFAMLEEDPKRTRNHTVWLRDILRNYTTSVTYARFERAAGGHEEDQELGTESSWIEQIAGRPGSTGGLVVRDTIGHVPRLNPAYSRANALWAARFLSGLRAFPRETGPRRPFGVAILLRPFESGADERSALFDLRHYFEHAEILRRSDQATETKPREKGSASTTRATTSNTEDHAAALRHRGIQVAQELIRSGAWWVSVRAFGRDASVAQRVAALYWTAVSGVATDLGADSADYPRTLRSMEPRAPRDGEPAFDDAWGFLLERDRHVIGDRQKQRLALQLQLKRHGIDFGFATREEIVEGNEDVVRRLQSVVLPAEADMLLSGERLASLIQLPAEPNPAIPVTRGFSYCFIPRPYVGQSVAQLGFYATSPQPIGDSGMRDVACLPIDHLTKHALVIGATGSGKTTTVVRLVEAVREAAEFDKRTVHIAVLEGAKREYRSHARALGLERQNRFDLMSNYISLHLFEHPPYVAPESHVSQIAALFEATLDMPAPVPILMREAISRAYSAFHAEPDTSPRKRLHPVRYWLQRALLAVATDCGYEGETKHNIDAALRTRLRALGLGTCGRVLSGASGGWEESARKLTGATILLELESIADRHSRSLVMSLFVLYYRYALKGRSSRLTNLLVLEEAHRIIGKTTGASEANASLEYFGNLLGEVRALGCGVVISDQSPSRLIDDAMRNTNTKVIMRLVSGDDIRAAVDGAGLPDSAEADIPQLEVGQGIFITPDRLPALVRFQRSTSKSEEDVEESLDMGAMRRALAADENSAMRTDILLRKSSAYSSLEKLISGGLAYTGDVNTLRDRVLARAGCACNKVVPATICETHRELVVAALLGILDEEAAAIVA